MPDAAERASSEHYKGVGDRLAAIRHLRRLSLRDAGRLTGITHAGLDRIEKGITVPLVSTCEQLAVAFGVAPSWLTYGEGRVPEGVAAEAELVRGLPGGLGLRLHGPADAGAAAPAGPLKEALAKVRFRE